MSYTLIGEHKKDARANRDGYIAAMTELMENDPTIVHVDCDLGGCINVGKLQAKFPDRVFNEHPVILMRASNPDSLQHPDLQ